AFGLGIVPDAEVVLIDEADLLDARRLDKDEPETTERIAAEMHDMKRAAGVSGITAVVDHRRHDEAVLHREAPKRKPLEQHRPCCLSAAGCSVIHRYASSATPRARPPRTRSRPQP